MSRYKTIAYVYPLPWEPASSSYDPEQKRFTITMPALPRTSRWRTEYVCHPFGIGSQMRWRRRRGQPQPSRNAPMEERRAFERLKFPMREGWYE